MRNLAIKINELFNRWKARHQVKQEQKEKQERRNRFKIIPHSVRVRWNNDSKPFRGPVMGPLEGWQKGGRQVRRAALFLLSFAQVNHDPTTAHFSRRTRRATARINVKIMLNLARAQARAKARPVVKVLDNATFKPVEAGSHA